MNLRPLGGTGLAVTRVGLGLAALGRPAYITLGRTDDLGVDRSVAAMEARCHAVLDAAWNSGIRYFDAARSYGLAESFLGSWLTRRGLLPADLVIGSKWGYRYVGDWKMDAGVHESKDLSAPNFDRQIAETRSQLGRHLDLYQIHSATLDSGVLDDVDVLRRLMCLRHDGVSVGLSVTGPDQAATVRRACAIELDGVKLFQTVQATWNLLEPSAGDALREAHEGGRGVIVKEALANGRLTGGYGGPEVEPLRQLASRLQLSVDALAIGAALAQPWADTILSGAVTNDQLASNLAGLATNLSELLPSIAESPAEYWQRRRTLEWN